jgi:hypothetical protein
MYVHIITRDDFSKISENAINLNNLEEDGICRRVIIYNVTASFLKIRPSLVV